MKKIFTYFIFSFILVVSLTGCSSSGGGANLEISGSTSMAPLMEKVKEAYVKKTHKEISISPDGSSAGIKAASAGVSDIGMSSRPLDSDELKLGMHDYKIAIDAIGVIVSGQNKVNNLSVEQIQKIFSGKITNWKEVGGADIPIVLVSRESGSGTKSAFEETIGLLNEDGSSMVDVNGPITVNSTGAVIENVGSKKGAIGYMSLESVDEKVKMIGVDGVKPDEHSIADGKYKLSRDFHLIYKDDTGEVKEFVNYLKSKEGQEEIRKAGYIPGKVE